MLSKRERIPRRELASNSGRRVVFAYGVARVLSSQPPKGAVVVSKKNFKTAVLRHRVRRKVLAVLRALIRNGALSGGVIVYPNQTAVTAPARDIESALRKIL